MGFLHNIELWLPYQKQGNWPIFVMILKQINHHRQGGGSGSVMTIVFGD
jgi:hypothetical protein